MARQAWVCWEFASPTKSPPGQPRRPFTPLGPGQGLHQTYRHPVRSRPLERGLADYEQVQAPLGSIHGLLTPAQKERQVLARVGIGRIEYRRDHLDSAVTTFRRAEVPFERLTRERPETILYWQGLAMCNHVIVNLLIGLDQPARTVAAYNRALRLREGLARAFPDCEIFRSDLVCLTETRAALAGWPSFDDPVESGPRIRELGGVDRSQNRAKL